MVRYTGGTKPLRRLQGEAVPARSRGTRTRSGTILLYSLLEDSRGAIWTGNSLSRYDPRTETFTRSHFPQASRAGAKPVILQRISEDRSGFLWLGIQRGKKAVYASILDTGKLTSIDIGGDLPANTDIAITSMYRDPAGIFWLGGSSGLFRFDPSTGASTHYPQRRPNGLHH